MTDTPDSAASLDDWLRYIGSVHPRSIELGLERGQAVLTRMALGKLASQIVTVGGTNGKGSTVAAIEFGLRRQGLRTGAYTSPHLDHFNERVRIDGGCVGDAQLCEAFAVIEQARGDISLSYFEFATLAAFYLFAKSGLDVVVLEVGLGGRLDAVNLVDADIAVITSISIDHVDWLGDDRDVIGFEKAGIARGGKPLVCSERDLPATITEHAKAIGSHLYHIGSEFDLIPAASSTQGNEAISAQSSIANWSWYGQAGGDTAQRLEARLPSGNFHPDNLAAALQTLALLGRLPGTAVLNQITDLPVPARFERRLDAQQGKQVLLDVAHNPGGATRLASRLQQLRALEPHTGRIIAVLAVMADKDLESMTIALQSEVDIWYIAQVEEARCMPAREAAQRVEALVTNAEIQHFPTVTEAYDMALHRAHQNDLILVTGSFYTVAEIRRASAPQANPE